MKEQSGLGLEVPLIPPGIFQSLEAAAKKYNIDLDKPISKLSKDDLKIILYGKRRNF